MQAFQALPWSCSLCSLQDAGTSNPLAWSLEGAIRRLLCRLDHVRVGVHRWVVEHLGSSTGGVLPLRRRAGRARLPRRTELCELLTHRVAPQLVPAAALRVNLTCGQVAKFLA